MPFDIPVLYRDDDIVVVDKPHFLATMPRGGHVAQTATVRLRRELDLPELSPAHRLDRLTAGVLLFTARREVRGAYQTLFARGEVRKTYLARAAVDPALEFPMTLAQPNHQGARSVTGVRGARRAERRDVDRASRRRAVPADSAHRPHASAAGAHGVAGPADHRRLRCIRTSSTWRATTSPSRCGCWRTASSSTIRSADVCVGLSAGAVSTNDWLSVGRLWQYPVKSMQGEEVDEILLGPGGVAGDRAYGFVDVETGRLASAKRPRRFGPLLDCRARFLTAAHRRTAIRRRSRSPFPTAPWSHRRDDGAELTRRAASCWAARCAHQHRARGRRAGRADPADGGARRERLGGDGHRRPTATATASCRSRRDGCAWHDAGPGRNARAGHQHPAAHGRRASRRQLGSAADAAQHPDRRLRRAG